MDFLEQIFGLNVDGGDGSFELGLFLVCLLIATVPVVMKIKRMIGATRSS